MMQTNAYREEQTYSIDNDRPYKVHGEVYDKNGYRMDVTIWFRHKNEVFYYVDTEGDLHGPMDKKHSINLAGIHKVGHGYGYHHESTNKEYLKESHNRPVSADLDGLLSDLDRLRKTNAERNYKATYSYEPGHHLHNAGHMSKWSSWSNNVTSNNRYATTVTRQHINRAAPQTVEVVVKRPPSLGASKVDLVSVETPRPFYRSSSSHLVTNENYQTNTMTNREKMLIDELLEIRKDLNTFKRSQSQLGIQTPLGGTQNNIHGSQYFNENWSTRSLKKTEGPPNWKMQSSPRPIRTHSQTNILTQPARIANNWTSETNIRANVGKTGYSAHRENAQHEAMSQAQARESYLTRNIGDGKYYEELEVITLQPIGKGVQDLQAGTFVSTLPRSTGFRSGQQSPSISNYNRQKFSYESNTDIRSRMGTGKNFVSPQISVSNANQQHSSMFSAGGAMGHTEGQFMDSETGLRHSLDTQNIWYRPNCSREEVIDMLRGEEAGRFIIRKSTTFSNSYGLALKVNKLEPRMMNKIDDASSELVRHFLIESVDGGVHLRGFADEQVFKSLAHFVHHHTVQKDALPCRLRLPQSIRSTGGIEVSNTGAVSSGIGGGSYSLNRTGSIGSREFQTSYIRANSQIERLDRNRGIKFDIGYLGHVVVDRLCEDAAARRGTTEVLTQYEQSHLPKKCIATIEAIPGDGIYINDFSRRGLVKKFIKASDVEWIGYDPEVRTYTDKNLSNLSDARIIVIVAQKQKLILHENSAYVLCELNSANSNSIITYIRNNFVSASRD